jgi:hypothetical protein
LSPSESRVEQILMPKTKKTTTPHQTAADTTEAVDKFMSTLEHPCKAEVAAIRKLILGVDDSVREGIKWNVPSFRTHEYFATMNLRAKQGVGIVLHLGAKARELPKGGLKIDDPAGLLRWLGTDRAIVEFNDGVELKSKRKELQTLLGHWLEYV